jgi:osmoprotectant transport system ATP-binding protein
MAENTKEIAIEYQEVCKAYPGGKQLAVDQVSLKIEAGALVTILGTSGSGKTTLLKMTNRLLDATRGTIRYFGENIAGLPINEYRKKLGYVIQQSGLFPHKTVYDNIATAPKMLGWDRKKIELRVDELLEKVSLPPQAFKKRYPRQLSGGQQQRVGLARALAANPSLILMDEPFGAIDALTRKNLQNELLRLHDELHNTILFVTHDIQEAFKLGHKIIIMDSGKVQQYDTPANIVLHPQNAYVKELISTEDIFERLRVLYVENHTTEITEEEAAKGLRLPVKTSLSDALTVFLQQEVPYLVIELEDHTVLGKLEYRRLSAIVGSR